MAEEERAEREEDDRLARRYREARDYGFARDEARAFAADDRLDIGALRRLRDELRCPGRLAARILL